VDETTVQTPLQKMRETLAALSPEDRDRYLNAPDGGWRALSLEERRAIVGDALEEYLSEYVKTVPDFIVATGLALTRLALENLQRYIEDAKDPSVSWDSPFVELRFAAPWDWENVREALPQISDADLESFLEALTKGTMALFEDRYRKTLQMFTKGACLRKKDGILTNLVSPWVQKALDEMSEKEREDYLKDWGEPVTFGAVILDADEVEDASGDPVPEVPEAVAEKLSALEPFLPFKGDVDGKPLSGSVVISFHPLLVDEDAKEAFYPMVTGLHFDPDPETLEEPDPSTWSEKDRVDFWTGLLQPLTEEIRKLEANAPDGLKTHELSTISETHTLPPVAEGLAPDARRVTLLVPVPAPPDTPPESGPAMVPLKPLTMAAAGTVTPSVSVSAPRPERARYLLDSETRITKATASFLAGAGALRLPRKKWSAIPTWEDLEEREKKRLLEEYGDDAFEDSDSGRALLVRRASPKGEEIVHLTRAALEDLEASEGGKGFRRVETDPDRVRREYLVRRFRAGAGHITAKLSWYGTAWPLAQDGPEAIREELERLRERAEQGHLFDELTPTQKDYVENRLQNLEYIRDGKKVMETIARKFGAEGRNPVPMAAWELKALLACEKSEDGMERVRGCLRALQEVRFDLQATQGSGAGSFRAFGPFLAEVRYVPSGPGDHADGDFSLTVSEGFIGCLRVFNVKGQRVRDAKKALLFEWDKKLSREEKKVFRSEPFIRGFSRLLPHFDQAKGFEESQSRLVRWIEANLTRRDDSVSKARRAHRVKKDAPDANGPRSYGRDFCPLLPVGGLFGALGHFRKNPESGFKLGGTATSGTETGGGHTEGLLAHMGHEYPSGGAKEKRQKAVRAALGDLQTVVQDALQGVAAARMPDGTWLTLTEAAELPEKELVQDVKWCLFVSKDFKRIIADDVEAHHAGRLARGEVDYPIKVTTDRAEAERSERERLGERFTGKEGTAALPLHVRVQMVRKRRGLTLAAVGKLFGVSHPVVIAWETGPGRDAQGQKRGKPIPEELVPLVLRWIEEETPPTAEELASRRTRRAGKRRET
jgi:DNA-binding XRE family transcriptional regulator